jgi:hypothetical protein
LIHCILRQDGLASPFGSRSGRWSIGRGIDPLHFTEQKKIFARCKGLFYACAGGAEARHFNRMLIDAGLIKNL